MKRRFDPLQSTPPKLPTTKVPANPDPEAALSRARDQQSTANYSAIFAGFEAKGIATNEIKPRENIFTYSAWLAQGRQVRKGEHGVRIRSVLQKGNRKINVGAAVFHINQTDPIDPKTGEIAAKIEVNHAPIVTFPVATPQPSPRPPVGAWRARL